MTGPSAVTISSRWATTWATGAVRGIGKPAALPRRVGTAGRRQGRTPPRSGCWQCRAVCRRRPRRRPRKPLRCRPTARPARDDNSIHPPGRGSSVNPSGRYSSWASAAMSISRLIPATAGCSQARGRHSFAQPAAPGARPARTRRSGNRMWPGRSRLRAPPTIDPSGPYTPSTTLLATATSGLLPGAALSPVPVDLQEVVQRVPIETRGIVGDHIRPAPPFERNPLAHGRRRYRLRPGRVQGGFQFVSVGSPALAS